MKSDNGFDIILEGHPAFTDEKLAVVFAEAFRVSVNDVLIEHKYAQRDLDVAVRCILDELDGDFGLLAAFYTRIEINSADVIKHICRRLDCRCLSDDGDLNPYTMFLYSPDGGVVRVSLDDEDMAENRYRIYNV